MKRLIILASSALLLAGPNFGWTQEFPTRPITLVVPYTAGGPTDVAARLLADGLSKEVGQSIIVENKAGAATVLAAEYVARAPADGYTLLMSAASTFVTNPHLNKNLSYDTKDFEPVAMVSKVPNVLNVALHVPAKNMKEFVEWARSRPNGATYGTAGVGSSTHIMGELFAKQFDIPMTHIPYQGASAANIDVIAGNIDSQIDGIAAAQVLHKEKKTRIIGLFNDTRWPSMPDVPTLAEQGYPNAIAYSWFAIVAPKGTPAEVVESLNAAVNKVLESEDLQARFIDDGQTVIPMSVSEARVFINEEYERWGQVIRDSDIKVE